MQTQASLRYTKFGNWKWTISADTAEKNNVSLNSMFFYIFFFFQIAVELKIYADSATH